MLPIIPCLLIYYKAYKKCVYNVFLYKIHDYHEPLKRFDGGSVLSDWLAE